MADESNQTAPQNVNRGCHFTSLPAELQNIIYELALIMPDERDLSGKKRDCSIFLSNSAISLEYTPFGYIETRIPCSCTAEDESIDYPCPMHVSKLIFKKILAPSLLRVCKKMRRECTPILYGCNSFKMDTPAPQHFLRQIGPVNKSYLTRLCIVDFFAPIGICANPYHYSGDMAFVAFGDYVHGKPGHILHGFWPMAILPRSRGCDQPGHSRAAYKASLELWGD